MKKIFFLCALYLLGNVAHGQRLDTATAQPLMEYEQLMKRHKSYKTAAWVTFGVGLGVAATGFYLYFKEQINSTYEGTGEPIFYLGAVSAVASIPLFITAGRAKKRALALKGGSVSYYNSSGSLRYQPALGISLGF